MEAIRDKLDILSTEGVDSRGDRQEESVEEHDNGSGVPDIVITSSAHPINVTVNGGSSYVVV